MPLHPLVASREALTMAERPVLLFYTELDIVGYTQGEVGKVLNISDFLADYFNAVGFLEI